MKSIFTVAAIVLLGFSGCTDKTEPQNQTTLRYFLAGYQSGGDPNRDVVSISDSLYYYDLRDDGTFLKQVGTASATGTFTNTDPADFDGIILNFENPKSEIIHSCIVGKEYLENLGNNELSGIWEQCDGPKLFFRAASNSPE